MLWKQGIGNVSGPKVPKRTLRPVAPTFGSIKRHLRGSYKESWFSNFGPTNLELERTIAKRVGVSQNQVATATNATLAIAIANQVLASKSISAPTFSFLGSTAGVRLFGADLAFIDVDPKTWEADSRLPQSRPGVSNTTISVPIFGSEIRACHLASKNTVVDAAAGILWLESLKELSPLGPNQAVVFSLHATKPIMAGEGAIVVFGSEDFRDEFIAMCQFGISVSGSPREQRGAGINAKMSEFSAAVALASLDSFEKTQGDYRRLHGSWVNMLPEFPLVAARMRNFGHYSPYLILECQSAKERGDLSLALNREGVASRPWYQYLPSPEETHLVIKRGRFDYGRLAATTHLGLPYYRKMSTRELRKNLSKVEGFLARQRHEN